MATAAAGKMIALPNEANQSAAISPPNCAPASDGSPTSATVAATSRAIAAQLVRAPLRRPPIAATIISTMAPMPRISSGRMGAKLYISAPAPRGASAAGLAPSTRCESPAGVARSIRSSSRPTSARIGRMKLSG